MVAQRPWGFWTENKLDMLSDYLPAFTTASKKALSTVYLDLFAGQARNVNRDSTLRRFPRTAKRWKARCECPGSVN